MGEPPRPGPAPASPRRPLPPSPSARPPGLHLPDPESHPAVLLQDLGGGGCSGAAGLAQGHPASCGDRHGRLSSLQPWGPRLGVPFPGSPSHPVTVVLPRVASAPGAGSVRAGRWGGRVWGSRSLAVKCGRETAFLPLGEPPSPLHGGHGAGSLRLPGVVWRRGPRGRLRGASLRTRALLCFIRLWIRCTCDRAWHTVDPDRIDPRLRKEGEGADA